DLLPIPRPGGDCVPPQNNWFDMGVPRADTGGRRCTPSTVPLPGGCRERRVRYMGGRIPDNSSEGGSVMALLEDVISGWTGGVLVGLGAAVIAPVIVPGAGASLRPVAKTLVKGVLVVADGVKGVIAEATEQVSDLVAEVRAESAGTGDGSGVRR